MSNFGCCGGNKKEINIVADEGSLDVILASRKGGQRYIHGAITKKRYGYFDQGDLIPAVDKADIRARPSEFVCANCRRDLIISSDDVYCGNCSRITELSRLDVSKLADRLTEVRPQSMVPMPPVPRSTTSQGTLLENIDFGRTVNKKHKKILAENGILSLRDVQNTGFDGLVEIAGIGDSIADALLEAVAELEIP